MTEETNYIGTATYSPEDNKLRLYPFARLDTDTYKEFKEAGFSWAPKQGLFVAPMWTPAREDLLLKYCEEIEAEEMTLAERAEVKAERLQGYAENRLKERNAYHRAADFYSERFSGGQPILVGHHSERSARVAQKRIDSAMNQAAKREKTADWHLYKASGAIANANHKNSARTRANRIETLLKDYRDKCKTEMEYRDILEMWTKCDSENFALGLASAYNKYISWEAANKLREKPSLWEEMRENLINIYTNRLRENSFLHRWKAHIINRLGYEKSLMGETARYSGEVTTGVVQVFARTWGVIEPKARNEENRIELTAKNDLPPFISENALSVCLEPEEWKDLFIALGYEPPAAIHNKSTQPPLLNIDCEEFKALSRYHRGQIDTYKVVKVTKAEYAKLHNDYKGTALSTCGGFRFRVAMGRALFGANSDFGWSRVAVFLTDQKAHELPQVAS